jgi:phosphocarrier protein
VTTARREAVVGSPTGLHARPAVQLVKHAKTFAGTVRLGRPGQEPVDAKSLVKVLGLKARAGETVMLSAEGEGADAIVDELARIVAEHG